MLTSHPIPFLGTAESVDSLNSACTVIIPFGYEGGVSYGTGTGDAPEAVLKASHYLELYDAAFDCEPYTSGIYTLSVPRIARTPEKMVAQLQSYVETLLAQKKFVVVIGGDHSITLGYLRALKNHYPEFGVVQMDAHADLRDSYDGSPFSHACTMARALETTPFTLQIGIRSISAEEARRAKIQKLALYSMQDWRNGRLDIRSALEKLPNEIFLTLDVDVFDWSVVASTGTPEPGGCYWDEALELLDFVFAEKNVVGVDVVELSHKPQDANSPFAVAKLIYKMIGMRFHRTSS